MKKADLLKSIEGLFFEKTFSEVSLQDIADKLGMKKASLYYYFSSKENLFKDLLEYSFLNYYNSLKDFLKQDLNDFSKSFIYFPYKSKNVFSIVNQNGYCENEIFKDYIKLKQQEIFNLISKDFLKKYNFSQEKTFIYISLLEDLGRKKCIFGGCLLDFDNILKEISLIFKK